MKIQSHDVSDNLDAPKYSLAQLTVEEFHIFWPHMEREMDKIPHTWERWTKEYVQAAVEAGSLVVWALGPPPDAVLIFFTQVSLYPKGRILTVPLGFGSFSSDMIPLIDATLTKYAQIQECDVIEVRGRGGWEKHFTPYGFKRDYVTLSRRVPNIRMQ